MVFVVTVLFLGKDCPQSFMTGIRFQPEGLIEVSRDQYRGSGDSVDKLPVCFDSFRR